MSKDTDAWMPLYVSDYLRDTRHLSTLEHGAYFLLIMHAWTAHGRLPLDEVRLARIAGMTTKEWKASRDVLLDFFQREDDAFTHKRIAHELARADGLVEQRRAAGKASAEARKRQRNSNDCSTSVATDEQRNGRPSPSPSPIEEGSVADATDGEPSPEADPGPPIDPEKHMFDAGVRLLGEAQIPAARARPMLGKWKRDHGAEAVIVALGKAQREGAIDPISFIEGCFRNGHASRQPDSLDLRGRRPDPAVDMYRNAVAREAAEGSAGYREDDFGAGVSLPSYLTS